MISKSGYEVESPRLRIGGFYNYLVKFFSIETIAIYGDLLISDNGHEYFTDEDWAFFKPTKSGLVEYWSSLVFNQYADFIIEDDSLFAIFIESSTQRIISVYSIWDNSIENIYFDSLADTEKLLEGLVVKPIDFPGAYRAFNKIGNGLHFIEAVIEGKAEIASL